MERITDEEQDACVPTEAELKAYLAEPDDAIAKALNEQEKRHVAINILYGRNIAQKQYEADQAQIPAIVEQEIKQLCKDCKSLEWFAQENQQRKKIEQAERAAMERVDIVKFLENTTGGMSVLALNDELDLHAAFESYVHELLGKGDEGG